MVGVGSVSDSRFAEEIRNLPYWRARLDGRLPKKLIDSCCKYKTEVLHYVT